MAEDVELDDPLVATEVVVIDEQHGELAPLERMAFGAALSGAADANRCTAFPLIQARNDPDRGARIPEPVPRTGAYVARLYERTGALTPVGRRGAGQANERAAGRGL
jgi:hypothetical protein